MENFNLNGAVFLQSRFTILRTTDTKKTNLSAGMASLFHRQISLFRFSKRAEFSAVALFPLYRFTDNPGLMQK